MTEIQFTAHLSWKIIDDGHLLFQCDEGKNQIPAIEQDKNKDKWKKELADVLKKCSRKCIFQQ